MLTLDANIFVRNMDTRDSQHAACHALLAAVQERRIPVICPEILLPEVAVARCHGCTLVTLDDDPQRRAGSVVTVQTPDAALATLPPPPGTP